MNRLRNLMRDGFYRGLRLNIHPPLAGASTLIEIVHLRRCLTERNINCVLDVGANEGQFATRLRRLGYAGRIYSFEPNPQAFQKLLELHGSDRRWHGFPVALGSINETKPFYIHVESSLSSFLSPVDTSKVIEVKFVEVQRLDALLHSLTNENPNLQILLKLDTQGWDIEVVKGAGDQLGHVAALLSELSVQALYDGMTPYHEALAFYASQGFVLYDVTPINHAADGTIVECDCLMVRKASTAPPESMSTRQGRRPSSRLT